MWDFKFSQRQVWSLVFWDVAPCSHAEVDRHFISEVRTVSIITLMELVRTSETSVNFNMTTQHYIPED
jgi:hypothetical protein